MTKAESRPLIGLTCTTNCGADWAEYVPGQIMDYVFRDYSLALEAAGGIPVLIPVGNDAETPRRLVPHLDGLLLTGGHDVFPGFFDQEPIVGCGEMDYYRDMMELTLTGEAEKAGVPIMGICRGIQVLCVAFQGTLYQDICKQVPNCLEHQQKAAKKVNTHMIRVERSSRLFSILGAEKLWVNSHHHQAVKEPPPGFVITAKARDGMVEAIERTGASPILGVQWHPEGTWAEDSFSRRLFEWLVQTAEACQS